MEENRGIKRIEKALAKLGQEHKPPRGWRRRVIEKTGEAKRSGDLALLIVFILLVLPLAYWVGWCSAP